MQALPTAPMATPRRQVFVGTALALGAAATALGAMLAMWLRYRDAAISVPGGSWLPKDVSVPMVPANVMLIACLPICIFAQWAVYSAKRQDKPHAGLALGLVALLAIAVINAQAYIYSQMAVPVNEVASKSFPLAPPVSDACSMPLRVSSSCPPPVPAEWRVSCSTCG